MNANERLDALATQLNDFTTEATTSLDNIAADIQRLKDEIASGQPSEETLTRLENIGARLGVFKQSLADLAAATPESGS